MDERKHCKKTIPYDIRIGKIKGKFVLIKTISQKEKMKIIKSYNRHLQKNLKTNGCSLNEYLYTARICYKAAFGKKMATLSALEMYKKWADTRDGRMLAIKNWDSRKAFSSWYKSGKL